MVGGIDSGKGQGSARRVLTLGLLSLTLLAPGAANPGRLWQAAQCTISDVTAQATRCYDTIRFVYRVQRQSERRQAAQ